MKQDAGAYLGLPEGRVVVLKSMSRADAVNRMKEIMDEWEKRGYEKTNDVPDGELKSEFKYLALNLKIKV